MAAFMPFNAELTTAIHMLNWQPPVNYIDWRHQVIVTNAQQLNHNPLVDIVYALADVTDVAPPPVWVPLPMPWPWQPVWSLLGANGPTGLYRYSIPPYPIDFASFVRRIFYVGIGQNIRPFAHIIEALNGEDSYKCDRIRHILNSGGQRRLEVIIIASNVPVMYARDLESSLIIAYGGADQSDPQRYYLTNQNTGSGPSHISIWNDAVYARFGIKRLHDAYLYYMRHSYAQQAFITQASCCVAGMHY